MAEWFSEPFIEYLRQVNHDVPKIDKMTAAELCAMDPVNVSIHFQKKWNAIFTKLINNKENGIFGEVEDFFYRIEYQTRGAGHTHIHYYGLKTHLSSVRTRQKKSNSTSKRSVRVNYRIRRLHQHCTSWSLDFRQENITSGTRNVGSGFHVLRSQKLSCTTSQIVWLLTSRKSHGSGCTTCHVQMLKGT